MSEIEDGSESLSGPDDGDGDTDQGYFQALEAAFIRLRGAPLLLSPADWQMAKQWRRRGIPVELVERVIGEVLEERRSRAGGDRIVTLKYFRRPVENAWNALGAIRASGVRGEAETFDAKARLEQLAASIPETFESRLELSRRILSIEGDPELIEEKLTLLEDELLQRLESELSEDQRLAIVAAVQKTLSNLGSHVGEAEIAATRARLERESVRRHFGLPILSLFAVRS